jgi:hypothetical protein
MATLKELMGDKTRGDGRKFTLGNDVWFEPIFKDRGGKWTGLNDEGYCEEFSEGEIYYWEEWMQPKKVKLYRPIYRSYENHYRSRASDSNWHTDKKSFDSNSIVGWMEIEVEVTE